MWFVTGALSLLGRMMVVAVFLFALVGHGVSQFTDVAAKMTAKGIPAASAALVVGMIVLVVGCVLVVLGYYTRLGALLLLLLLAGATATFCDYWTIQDEVLRAAEAVHFMQNVAIAGALVFLLANGGGAWSLDSCAAETDDELV